MTKDILGVDIRHLTLFRSRLASLSRDEQFKKIATMFLGATYKMGSENFNECDCSGLICSSLLGMGYKIRVTANEIIEKCCNESYLSKDGGVGIMGLFDDKVGKYTHIGIVFHSPRKDTLLHSSYPKGVAFEDLNSATSAYRERGFRVDFFTLDFDKVEELDGESYGLDEDFK